MLHAAVKALEFFGFWTAASLVTAGAWWAIAHFFKTRTTKTPGGSR
jgi:hypothetical protein